MTPPTASGTGSGGSRSRGSEPVLAPTVEGLTAQVIDVDDLAEFIVDRGASQWHGVANATGDSIALGALLALARETAGHTGHVDEADDDWLDRPRRRALGGSALAAAVAPARHAGIRDALDRGVPAPPAGTSATCARRSSAPSPTSASAASIVSGSPGCPVRRSSTCSPTLLTPPLRPSRERVIPAAGR